MPRFSLFQRYGVQTAFAFAWICGLCSCGVPVGTSAGGNPGAQEQSQPAPQPPQSSASAASPAQSPSPPGAEGPCPAQMALVDGQYCLTPEYQCLDQQSVEGGEGPGHCIRYAEPSTCFDARRKPLRFCMDIYEWPNQKGAIPMVLVSWEDARDLCESVGKRLCTEEEFNFACEGEEMRPYVYGHVRDPKKCNFDRPYRERKYTFLSWTMCMNDPDCRDAFAAIDQRMPAGSLPECRSDDGIFDLNGNVNEWVFLPQNKAPHRSGIKGGWWGPVRNRCRPTVTFHDEGDFGYEVGFRCCSDPN